MNAILERDDDAVAIANDIGQGIDWIYPSSVLNWENGKGRFTARHISLLPAAIEQMVATVASPEYHEVGCGVEVADHVDCGHRDEEHADGVCTGWSRRPRDRRGA